MTLFGMVFLITFMYCLFQFAIVWFAYRVDHPEERVLRLVIGSSFLMLVVFSIASYAIWDILVLGDL